MTSHVAAALGFGSVLLLMCFVKCFNAKQCYFGHKVIRVIPETKEHLNLLVSLQSQFSNEAVDFWTKPSLELAAVDISLSPSDAYENITSLLSNQGIKFTVQIPNLQSAIDRQNGNQREKREMTSWFDKYHTLDEIFSQLKETAAKYKERVRMFTFGKSYEGRQLYAVEIQSTPQVSKPMVFINCGIHAREWVSPATCMYIVHQLASRGDVTVHEILNKVDVVIMPVFNVDGYVYTWGMDRMWRKNRSLNPGSECVGTDLNRNWGFSWGENGASSQPCSDNYHGSSAMSESEVQHVARFLESQGKRLVGYLDIHSYSQIWMFPWGYTKKRSRDYDELMRVSKDVVDAIKTEGGYNTNYTFGQASDIMYIESGTTKDYMYGHLHVQYTFSMELRDTGKYGFLLPNSLIIPTAKEAFEGIKAMILNMKLKD
ncbi:corticosteroid- binding protein [Desmophyllum pertusum]|uniref:Corticosteroid- binding protein n=1 Tax=Desmophyllum pertusum TaxID=174260 RepID=A0A9W9YVN1_9CNID|nr:corticosteroid- binding protein [Desmophyllum pertusum]